jgi:cellulose synthase/poly-beta-1,6-N-acetylglucosamine synthase-like glycosyltransferase
MKTLLITTIAIHLFFTIISFAINYKKATEPYFVKDAIYDFGLCFIPAINISYVIVVFYETFLEKHFNKITFNFSKWSSFMDKRLK